VEQLIGRVLGKRYEIVERIGSGGMSQVYKARCSLLNRYVAVKVLRPEYTSDENFIRKFRRESQAAASLSHQNIVSVYDVGVDDEVHYIVMEYIEGKTLKQLIQEKGRLSPAETAEIAQQICKALVHAHKNHIIHRDIKPHNILVTKDGVAKVTDFGIARAVTASTVTNSGNVIGSVHYFSPEQARGGFIDEKSDLYSLGIVIYEMITGQVPFEGESPISVALKHLQEPVKPPGKVVEDIPPGLEQIIMKAIEK
jgi:serine/threonine protein kinase